MSVVYSGTIAAQQIVSEFRGQTGYAYFNGNSFSALGNGVYQGELVVQPSGQAALPVVGSYLLAYPSSIFTYYSGYWRVTAVTNTGGAWPIVTVQAYPTGAAIVTYRSYIIASESSVQPFRLSEYYRGGARVPDIPANAAVPTSGTIKFSNMYSTTKTYYAYVNMFSIYANNSCCGDNDYFGGDIPRTFSWIGRRSNSYSEFTTPNLAGLKMTSYSWSVQLGAGYTYYDGGWFSSTNYYYDYQRNFGLILYNASNDTVVGSILNTTDQNYYTGPNYNSFTVPGGTINLSANTTYRLYYYCEFYRASDIGWGDVSFGWSGYGPGSVTIST